MSRIAEQINGAPYPVAGWVVLSLLSLALLGTVVAAVAYGLGPAFRRGWERLTVRRVRSLPPVPPVASVAP